MDNSIITFFYTKFLFLFYAFEKKLFTVCNYYFIDIINY